MLEPGEDQPRVQLRGRVGVGSVLIGSVLDNLEIWDSHVDQTGSGFPSGRFGELPLPVYVSQAPQAVEEPAGTIGGSRLQRTMGRAVDART